MAELRNGDIVRLRERVGEIPAGERGQVIGWKGMHYVVVHWTDRHDGKVTTVEKRKVERV